MALDAENVDLAIDAIENQTSLLNCALPREGSIRVNVVTLASLLMAVKDEVSLEALRHVASTWNDFCVALDQFRFVARSAREAHRANKPKT